MKKRFFVLAAGLFLTIFAYAETPAPPASNDATNTTTADKTDSSVTAPAPAPDAAPVAAATPAAAAVPENTPPPVPPAAAVTPAIENGASNAPASENLEFVSGEISGLDEAAKTVTVKLYGETENKASEKILTVKVDSATDITDGEQDRDLKSLTAGTEVDVEYDPSTNKATYIFVY